MAPQPLSLADLVGWATTLTEPLISLRRRARFEDVLARSYTHSREATRMFLAGMVADMVLTLPPSDPWRHLHARVAELHIGEQASPFEGAFTDVGAPFGTWRDALDVTPLIHASALDDPGLVALADDDLHPHAAAVLAAGGYGWRTALMVIEEIERAGPQRSETDDDVVLELPSRSLWAAGARAHHARECATSALRWAVHRRRSYRGFDDTWVGESAFRWAWRSTRSAEGGQFDDADVDSAIRAEALTDAMRPNLPNEDLGQF